MCIICVQREANSEQRLTFKIFSMKKILIIIFLFYAAKLQAQTHRLEKVAETDSIIAIPESVLPDLKNDRLFISLIDGASWDADGKGGIGILAPGLKKYNGAWITGLNAPKGMGLAGNRLYVADLGEVVVVDVKNGKIEKKIPIENASGLNDITIDKKGLVYVSDSRTGRIWRIENDQPSLFLDSVKGVNGLKAIGDDVYIGAGRNFIRADQNKKITQIVELPQGIDGIEPVGKGDFILTAWAGYIFYVTAKGTVETLLDSHNEKMNTADIGYDPDKMMLYVPTFNAKRIVVYQLK